MLSIRNINTLFHATGHLAIWVGLYCAGAAICFAQISGRSASAAVLLVAGLTAMSVYLIDRVKLSDKWLDPADREAHPDRFRFLGRRTTLIRLVALVLGLVAAGAAASIHLIASAFIPLAWLGVIVYAGLPRLAYRSTPKTTAVPRHRRRVKDIFLVKNIAVAVCITGFVSLLVLLALLSPGENAGTTSAEANDILSIASAWVFVFALVLADAIMCDIDDADADRKHGTATIPGRFGVRNAWFTAGALHAFAAIMLLVSSDGPSDQARKIWAGLICASFMLIAVCRPKTLRDLIDARLAFLALIAWLFV